MKQSMKQSEQTKRGKQTEQKEQNEQLVSYCGLYCGACTAYQNGKCKGCKGDSPNCAIGYRACKVRPCCMEKRYSTCAECKEHPCVQKCKDFNPLFMRAGCFLSGTSRSRGIEMIKEKGEKAFIDFMAGKKWVAIKVRGK